MYDIAMNLLFTFIGLLLGGIIGYKSKILSHKKTKFIDASIEFKQAFSKTVYWLENESKTSPIRTPGKLKSLKETHIDAINKFKIMLPKRKLKRFENACETFFCIKDGHYYAGYSLYDKTPLRESGEIALKNINKLLDFAKN